MAVEKLRREVAHALAEMGVDDAQVALERPRNPDHGDWSTNVALTLAKRLGRAPRAIADDLATRIRPAEAGISGAEVAGPGFLNFRLASTYVTGGLASIVAAGEAYGRSDAGGGAAVCIEFISELMEWAGYKVHREYYYNDAGEQIARLARSVWVRYQQALGADLPFPDDGYQGEYVREIARELVAEHGDRFRGDEGEEALDAMRRFAVARLRDEQNRDLDGFRVHFDEFFLESSLYTGGRVDETIRRLRETGFVYEKDGAVWLRTTAFGDDKDRVMVKSTGHPTYFLPDVAYHLAKWERGFRRAINVQGADHHGTTARVRAGVRALGLPEEYPEYVLHQMVLAVRGGEEVKFSKRAGSYVTMRDLYEEVGVDVARYFFLMRRAEAQLTFDIDLALDQSDKNPVYKVQYAHARMNSVFRRAGVDPAGVDASRADLALLAHPGEAELVKTLLRFPEEVLWAADRRSPHVICEYLETVAGAVNSWYNEGNRDPRLRVVGDRVPAETTLARLVLARAIQVVLRNGLALLGISAPTRLDRADAAPSE
jgi:arginyl-tRNA synthetase